MFTVGSELKHLGCEDILDARGNAWVFEILVYIEIAEEVKNYEVFETENQRGKSNIDGVD